MTSEDLYGALYDIGMETGEPIDREVLARLIKLKIVKLRADGRPTLTKHGEHCFTGLESGDWGTPAFDDELNQA